MSVASFSSCTKHKVFGTHLPIIDIGANLLDPVFRGIYRGQQRHQDDFDDVIDRSTKVGLKKIIVTAGQLKEVNKALEIVKHNSLFYTTAGCHPTRCCEFDESGDSDKYLSDLLTLALKNRDKVVAVGECGLDYDRLHFCPKGTQLKYFEKQFDISESTRLPMFFHCRNSSEDFLDIVKRNRDRFHGGVVHSFTGTKEGLVDFLDLGLYIGLNGCSLKTAENLEVVQSIPTERILVETDSPYCEIKPTHASFKHVLTKFESKKKEQWKAGCGVKGRNEPAHIIQVLEVLAAIHGEDLNEIADTVYNNTIKLFFSQG